MCIKLQNKVHVSLFCQNFGTVAGVPTSLIIPPVTLIFKELLVGRAIAQAVSRRLPTAAARVQTRVGMWDFVMDKSGARAGFLRELRFPLPIFIPLCSPQSSSLSAEAGTIGQEWPQCL
jgi:hypothetical protein